MKSKEYVIKKYCDPKINDEFRIKDIKKVKKNSDISSFFYEISLIKLPFYGKQTFECDTSYNEVDCEINYNDEFDFTSTVCTTVYSEKDCDIYAKYDCCKKLYDQIIKESLANKNYYNNGYRIVIGSFIIYNEKGEFYKKGMKYTNKTIVVIPYNIS